MVYKPSEIENAVMQLLGNVENPKSLGTIGQAMFTFVEQQKAKQVDNYTEEERMLIGHMRVLKEAEEQSNLMWVNYKSWNAVNVLFRENFAQTLKPLFWNGVFTRLTDFYEHETKVMSKLDPKVVASLFRKGGNYQLFCVSSDQKDYQIMNLSEFNTIASNISANIVRSYSKTDSRLYIKEFKQQNTQGGTSHEQSGTIRSGKDDPTPTVI